MMGPEIIWGLGIGYILISSILEHIPSNYSLKKVKKSGILKEPINLDNVARLSLNDCLRFEENNEIIKEFYEKLESNLGHCDLSAFYTNMRDLKILSNKDSFLFKLLDALTGTRTGGVYMSSTNKIHLPDDTFGRKNLKKSILTHELLHMASTRRDKKSVFTGFHLTNEKTSIGVGINEGYTELLNGRYFINPRDHDSYFDLQVIAGGIESIVGKEKMEKMYFSGDLNGLISELEKYVSKDEALTLILKCDALLKRNVKTNEKKAKALADEIRKDVADIKLKKLEMKKNAGDISERDYINGVYSLELFVNGFVPFKKKDDNGQIVNNFVSRGPLLKFEFVEISTDDFNKYADSYYNDFLNNGLYDVNGWSNKFGLTTKKMIEAKFSAKRQEQLKTFRNRLGLSNLDGSLENMFAVNVEKVEAKKAK